MAGAVRYLMEGGAVILSGLHELRAQGKRDTVGHRLIESPVAFLMTESDAAALNVSGKYGFSGFICVGGGLWQRLRILGGQPFALVDVEDVEVRRDNLFSYRSFCSCLIVLRDPLGGKRCAVRKKLCRSP